ncbi:MAG: DUF3795 domain-containing protein [candidate division Zixibacteria bacterium]|nr:DUF3795 domain-containing protein [candidate division Zixibacteria bacterium]
MKSETKLIGACGLYCGKCFIYLAHINNDLEKKAKIAENISRQVKKEIKPEQIVCEGCHAEDNLCWGDECKIRACCFEKGHEFCFECEDYPCPVLIDFGKRAEDYREAVQNLEEMKKIGVEKWLEKQAS